MSGLCTGDKGGRCAYGTSATAEDYANNQWVALAYLKRLGCIAHVVEHDQAAVDAIVQSGERYSLILMDWQMPVVDSLTATRFIRQHIPIIGVTANAIKGDCDQCLAAGLAIHEMSRIAVNRRKPLLNPGCMVASMHGLTLPPYKLQTRRKWEAAYRNHALGARSN